MAVCSEDGITYFLDTTDHYLSRRTYETKSFELDFMDRAIALVNDHCGNSVSDRTFIDIGANIGTSLIPAIVRYGASNVVAFEPSPRNVWFLRINLTANGLTQRVDVREVALSNVSGMAELELSPVNAGDHRVRHRTTTGAYGEGDWDTLSVPVTTLGDVGLSPHDVGLIWMDVQGHEGHVLAGAGEYLGTVPVVTEYWPYGLDRAGGAELFNGLIRENYRGFVVIRAGGRVPEGAAFSAKNIDSVAARIGSKGSADLLLLPRTP